jgi:hypothetical protein
MTHPHHTEAKITAAIRLLTATDDKRVTSTKEAVPGLLACKDEEEFKAYLKRIHPSYRKVSLKLLLEKPAAKKVQPWAEKYFTS